PNIMQAILTGPMSRPRAAGLALCAAGNWSGVVVSKPGSSRLVASGEADAPGLAGRDATGLWLGVGSACVVEGEGLAPQLSKTPVVCACVPSSPATVML